QGDEEVGTVLVVHAAGRQWLVPTGAVAHAAALRGVPQVQTPAVVAAVVALVVEQGLVRAGFEEVGGGWQSQPAEQQGEQVSDCAHGFVPRLLFLSRRRNRCCAPRTLRRILWRAVFLGRS